MQMQSCIIDSCSLLHAFHVQIAGSALCDLLADHFDVLVHRCVSEEISSVLRRAYPEWKQKGLVSEELSEIRRRHANWTASRYCDPCLDEPLRLFESEGMTRLGTGEKACVALAKHTSDERTAYTLLLTDDFEASQLAQVAFHKYQCGFVLRSADIISFFGLRFNVAKPEIHQAIRDLLSFYTNAYESLLVELTAHLPGGESSPIRSLVIQGDFTRAKHSVARLNISSDRRVPLESLVSDVARLSGEHSTVGYTLARLRLL
jgi:hypothetical protein